ncbi:hypothetical protein B0H14DRAFT_3484684 [Mycena olivaceomarginata]|nr:hypothetical protein B0H14DRAFT_3484684 [Mycena olivaceomarginata]
MLNQTGAIASTQHRGVYPSRPERQFPITPKHNTKGTENGHWSVGPAWGAQDGGCSRGNEVPAHCPRYYVRALAAGAFQLWGHLVRRSPQIWPAGEIERMPEESCRMSIPMPPRLELLAVDQTYDGLKTKTTALFDEMWLTMNLPAESYHALLWALRAYTVLLAPWSPVQLRVLRMGPLHTKGFAIFASRDLKANEFIYELSGLMSIDFVADHTNLSVVTYPGESTKHILFGPICLINHDCRPNVEFVHVTDTYAMTIQTNRAISQGEQLFIDYGREYWEDTQSPVKSQVRRAHKDKSKTAHNSIHGASTSSSKKKKKNGEEKHDANDTADRRREVDELL